MKYEDIEKILKLFDNLDIEKLSFRNDGFSLELEKSVGKKVEQVPVSVSAPTKELPVEEHTFVRAPLVGVFYEAPAPDAIPFVKVGDVVEEGQVICVIEAMKMINEIKSPIRGKVLRVLGENGVLVAFDQPLFEIEEQYD